VLNIPYKYFWKVLKFFNYFGVDFFFRQPRFITLNNNFYISSKNCVRGYYTHKHHTELIMSGNKTRKLQKKSKFNRYDIIKSKLFLIIQILIVFYTLFYLYIPIEHVLNTFHKYEVPAAQTFICVRIK